ncbi:NERD domain-containing protein [Nocardia paucivorans]|uniref:NERD domain-containing protein n=1 Tax=Nocardia paucivorans TaxID=114259 RepID=UPI0002E380E7|nr:NERD domain-containing protein [Nocardia paucivorans]
MLVKVDDRAELTAAEEEFVECLRNFPTVGLAMVDLRVGTERGTRQIDAVIFTVQGVTVVEVVGFRRRQSGVFEVPTDGRWKVGSENADLDLAFGADPSTMVQNSVREVERAFERTGFDPGPLCGAVVVVPFRGSVLRPARVNVRPGLDVVVGNVSDAVELRIYLENFAPGEPRWTADRVRAATTALTGWAPGRDELLDAGFAEKLPERVKPLPQERVPEPTRGQATVGWLVTVAAIVGMLVVLAVVVTTLFSDGSDTEPAATTPSFEVTAPVPTRPAECWPLQPGC